MTTLNFLTKTIVSLVGVSFITLEATGAAIAAVVTFNTSDSEFTPGIRNQGWWSSTETNYDENSNYFVGNSGGNVLRNFFTFDISSLPTERIKSATLELRRFTSTRVNPTETLGLFDVSTDAATLNRNTGTSDAIFNDLGTGQSYGSFQVSTSGDSTDVLRFELNSAALADIENARNAGGQFFSIGGSLLSLPPDPSSSSSQYLFGFSNNNPVQSLVVTTVPEPLTILGSGMALGLGALMKRQYSRKRKKI